MNCSILERKLIKLCESLPGDLTIYEEDGLCFKNEGNTKAIKYCKYCTKRSENEYFCNKKTLTGDLAW